MAASVFRPGRRGSGLFEANVAVVLFGLAGLFGKLVGLPAISIVLGRVVFASLALGIFALASRTSLLPDSLSSFAGLAGAGLLLAFHWTTFFQSIQTSTVAIGLVSFATFPLFVTFLEPFLLGERLRARSIALALSTLAGAALVAFGPVMQASLFPDLASSGGGAAESGGTLTGMVWGLASAASFALLSILNKKSTRRLPSLAIAFHQDLAAAVALATLLLAAGPRQLPTLRDIGLLAILGILCTALAHTLFIGSLGRIRARTAAILGSLEPLYGAFFALLLLGEIPSVWTFAGGAVIVGSAVFAAVEASGPREAGERDL